MGPAFKKGITDIEILLSEKDRNRLYNHLKSKLGQKLLSGIDIKPVSGIEAGFRIMEKNGTAYFNLTDSGIAECISEFLNKRLASIVQDVIEKGS